MYFVDLGRELVELGVKFQSQSLTIDDIRDVNNQIKGIILNLDIYLRSPDYMPKSPTDDLRDSGEICNPNSLRENKFRRL